MIVKEGVPRQFREQRHLTFAEACHMGAECRGIEKHVIPLLAGYSEQAKHTNTHNKQRNTLCSDVEEPTEMLSKGTFVTLVDAGGGDEEEESTSLGCPLLSPKKTVIFCKMTSMRLLPN